jgi:hypothetical protein
VKEAAGGPVANRKPLKGQVRLQQGVKGELLTVNSDAISKQLFQLRKSRSQQARLMWEQ